MMKEPTICEVRIKTPAGNKQATATVAGFLSDSGTNAGTLCGEKITKHYLFFALSQYSEKWVP